MESLSAKLGGLLSTKEVADRMGISVAKAHRLIGKGILKPVTKADGLTGSYYFAEDELPAAS